MNTLANDNSAIDLANRIAASIADNTCVAARVRGNSINATVEALGVILGIYYEDNMTYFIENGEESGEYTGEMDDDAICETAAAYFGG